MSKKKKLDEIFRARKTIYSEPLVNISVMVRKDQHEHLKPLDNMSEWIRNAIDHEIIAEAGKTDVLDVVAISKNITLLEKRIQKLKETYEYKRAKHILKYETPERFKQYRDELKKGKEMTVKTHSINIGTWPIIQCIDDFAFYAPGWTRQSFEEFVSEKPTLIGNVKLSTEEAYAILDRMEKGLGYEKKVLEGFEKQVATLQAKIDRLKQLITK